MSNPQNLKQATEQLRVEAQRDAAALQQEEAELKTAETDKANQEARIKKDEEEMRQKETEIREKKIDIQKARSDISRDEATRRNLLPKIAHTKAEAVHKHEELNRVQAEYENALKSSGVKIKPRF